MGEHLQEQEQEQQPFAHQETIHYNDDQLALGFRTPGDRIVWGEHKYANPDASSSSNDRILVKTASGNVYAMGRGVIVNENANVAHDVETLPEGLPDITIGEPWEIPGFGSTTNVEAVMLRYKIGKSNAADKSVDRPNPFSARESLIQTARETLDQQQ